MLAFSRFHAHRATLADRFPVIFAFAEPPVFVDQYPLTFRDHHVYASGDYVLYADSGEWMLATGGVEWLATRSADALVPCGVRRAWQTLRLVDARTNRLGAEQHMVAEHIAF